MICALETEQDVEEEILRQYFVLAKGRTYEQDPNWGFIVLSEAAQRALSPAVNDPGTAINIMAIMMNLFVQEPEPQSEADVVEYDWLSIAQLDCAEWIRDAFAPISRDGAGILEVNVVMQKVLASIWRNVPEKAVSNAALLMAEQALARAEQALVLQAEREQLREKHNQLFHSVR